MSTAEHLVFAEELAWADWVAPNKAIPVRSVDVGPETTQMQTNVTGGGRGRRPGARGEIAVNGPMETLLYPTQLPFIIRQILRTRSQVAAGTGWRNKLLPDDNQDNGSLSLQKIYSPTLAESIKGAKINTMTISARSREYATAAFEFVAKDACSTGGAFRDGDAAPAVVSPVPYPVGMPDGFKFYEGEFILGGTVALTAGEIVVTGGTARCEIDNVEVEVNNNIATDAYGLCLEGGDTLSSADDGQREVTCRFDPNFGVVGAEFYNAWLAGEPAVAQLHFVGPEFAAGQAYELFLTLPHVVYTAAKNPEINADFGLKRSTVEADCYVDPTIGVDWGMVFVTTDDLVP